MRFTAQDMEAIRTIRQRYGCISDTAAVRLALQLALSGSFGPRAQAPDKDSPSSPCLQRLILTHI
jgi:hypothetical protein